MTTVGFLVVLGRYVLEVVHVDVVHVNVGFCVEEIVVFLEEFQIGLCVDVVPGKRV